MVATHVWAWEDNCHVTKISELSTSLYYNYVGFYYINCSKICCQCGNTSDAMTISIEQPVILPPCICRWDIPDDALKINASLRVCQLARPRSRTLAKDDDFDPYLVPKAARHAQITPRIEELSIPLPRKVRSKKVVWKVSKRNSHTVTHVMYIIAQIKLSDVECITRPCNLFMSDTYFSRSHFTKSCDLQCFYLLNSIWNAVRVCSIFHSLCTTCIHFGNNNLRVFFSMNLLTLFQIVEINMKCDNKFPKQFHHRYVNNK